MRVTVAYECELEEIPQTIFQLLGNLKDYDFPDIGIELQDAILSMNEGNATETLASMDRVRRKLARLDQKLLDLGSILGGYVRADTDIKLGTDHQPNYPMVPSPEGTQEVSAQDILAVEGEDKVSD